MMIFLVAGLVIRETPIHGKLQKKGETIEVTVILLFQETNTDSTNEADEDYDFISSNPI